MQVVIKNLQYTNYDTTYCCDNKLCLKLIIYLPII